MAGFNYTIVAANGKDASSIKAVGEEQRVITAEDQKLFGLGEKALKEAVGAHYGKVPNDAFLHSPTPWDDLYKTYGWKQVTTVVRPVRAEITEVSSKPMILATNTLDNSGSSHEASFSSGVTASETESFTSSWDVGGSASLTASVTASVMPAGVGASSTISTTFTQNWGVGGSESKTVTVASDSSVTVTLPPHTKAVLELQASKGVLKARVEYEASLIGYVAANYNPTYKGHHFWALDVGSVMASAGIENKVTFVEDLEIEYYSNTNSVVRDENNEVLAMHDSEGLELAASMA